MQMLLFIAMAGCCAAAGSQQGHHGRIQPVEHVIHGSHAVAAPDSGVRQPSRAEQDGNLPRRPLTTSQRPAQMVHSLSSRGGPVDVTEYLWLPFRATWYSSFDGGGQGTITATGSHVQDNWTVAVDPRVIPLGSLIEVRFADGTTHTYQALDTGGAIVGNHIDIFEHSRATCMKNGVQLVKVRILRRGMP